MERYFAQNHDGDDGIEFSDFGQASVARSVYVDDGMRVFVHRDDEFFVENRTVHEGGRGFARKFVGKNFGHEGRDGRSEGNDGHVFDNHSR